MSRTPPQLRLDEMAVEHALAPMQDQRRALTGTKQRINNESKINRAQFWFDEPQMAASEGLQHLLRAGTVSFQADPCSRKGVLSDVNMKL